MPEFVNNIESEFKDLYFKLHPKAYKIAYYILKEEQASEDIVQDVFLKIWQKGSTMNEISNIEAYLHQMVKNTAFNHLKSSPQNQIISVELEYEEQVHDQDNQLKISIEKAVSQLTPKCRLVFSLSRFEGLTNDEIADHLEMSKRTVETQISNALKMFRTDLKHFFEEYLVTIPILMALSQYFFL